MYRKINKNKGFTLVELAIVSAIIAIMATVGLYGLAQQMRYQLVHSQVDQLSVVSQALARYQVTYAANLTGSTPITGVSNILTPTIAELKTIKMLDSNFSTANLYGAANGYKTLIRVTNCPANCSVFGLSYLTSGIKDSKGRVDNAAIGEAITYGNGNVGASSDLAPAVISGIQGGWTEPSPLSAVPGILAMRSGDGAAGIAYLPLDGSGTMRGGLKMGAHAITGVTDLTASGTVTTNDLRTATATSTGLITGASLKSNSTIDASGKITGVGLQSNGTIGATGAISAGGNISTTANISASGGVSGQTITASGTVQGGSIISQGGVTASGTVQGATVQGTTITASGGMTAATMTATGQVKGGTLTSTGNVTATGTVQGATVTGTNVNATTLNVSGATYAQNTVSINSSNYPLIAMDSLGRSNAQAQSAAGSLQVNDIYIRSVGKWASQMATVTPPTVESQKFRYWQTLGSSGVAPYDGILVATSFLNTELFVYANGALRGYSSARDKYGQGDNSVTIPLMKGESYSVVGGSAGAMWSY